MKSKKVIAARCVLTALMLSALTGCESVGKLTKGIEKPRAEGEIRLSR